MKLDVYKRVVLELETEDIRIFKGLVMLAEQRLKAIEENSVDPAFKISKVDILFFKDVKMYIKDLYSIFKD